ncbi:MAG: phosphatase PAP2 family protein [Melioribacteraceae bacterium]|nr:phosphatase PAP2 family protein [Melioribacteraceae bacterium]
MNSVKSILAKLRAVDILVISFATILTLINLLFITKVDNWLIHIVLNSFTTIAVIFIAYYDDIKKNMLIEQLHYWYPVPLIFLAFKEFYFLVKPIREVDYDQLLIKADRFLFGGDPTHYLYKISNPVLTELLQIVYGTFFFLPVILGIHLLLMGRDKEFHFTTFTVVLGFFLSYLGYLLVPAIGPRFTLHDFELTNAELPGLFLTNYLREIVNAGESIPAGTINPALVVQRDVFPSGHTQMTLIVMYLSFKFRTSSRYFFLVNGSLLIFSTVYLRYHYVVDLIAGALFMVATMIIGKMLYNIWMKYTDKTLFEYPEFR